MVVKMAQHSFLSYGDSYQGLTQRKALAVTSNHVGDAYCQTTDSHNDDDSSQSSCSSDDSDSSLRYSRNSFIYLSIIASLCLISFGWFRAFYSRSTFSVVLKCDPQGCILREQHVDGDVSILHLHRHQLVRTDLVHLATVGKRRKERQVIKYVTGPYSSSTTAKPKLTTGDHVTSFALVYHEEEDHHHDHHEIPLDQPNVYPLTPHERNHDETEKLATYVFKPLDLSVKHDRVSYNNLKHYIGGQRTHAHVEHVGEKTVSWLGIFFTCIGMIGFFLSITVWIRRIRQQTWS